MDAAVAVDQRDSEHMNGPVRGAGRLQRVLADQWQAAGALAVASALRPGWLVAAGRMLDWHYLAPYCFMWTSLALAAAGAYPRRYRLAAALGLICAAVAGRWSFTFLATAWHILLLLVRPDGAGIFLVFLNMVYGALLGFPAYILARNAPTLWRAPRERRLLGVRSTCPDGQ